MKQFLRLSNKTTIQTPRECSGKNIGLNKLWGKGLFIEVEIDPGFCPTCFQDDLKDGKPVVNEDRVKQLATEKSERENSLAKESARFTAIKSIKESIDPTKSYDNLLPLERKLMFGIGGMPTDDELGI